ncbi:hypothetical protein F5Y09DRAFT_169316 [Xylaria sp. FL1042]|nr:hypothetical protein F5Y09DRAFT_169316 [Xylaria sp. FL1042]
MIVVFGRAASVRSTFLVRGFRCASSQKEGVASFGTSFGCDLALLLLLLSSPDSLLPPYWTLITCVFLGHVPEKLTDTCPLEALWSSFGLFPSLGWGNLEQPWSGETRLGYPVTLHLAGTDYGSTDLVSYIRRAFKCVILSVDTRVTAYVPSSSSPPPLPPSSSYAVCALLRITPRLSYSITQFWDTGPLILVTVNTA